MVWLWLGRPCVLLHHFQIRGLRNRELCRLFLLSKSLEWCQKLWNGGPEMAFHVNPHSYNPGDHLQKCRSPSPTKVPKKCFGKCRPQTGWAKESAEKVLRVSSLIITSTEARSPKHFSSTLLGTLFGAGTFRSTFSALLSGRVFGTSVNGRQDCTPTVPTKKM